MGKGEFALGRGGGEGKAVEGLSCTGKKGLFLFAFVPGVNKVNSVFALFIDALSRL